MQLRHQRGAAANDLEAKLELFARSPIDRHRTWEQRIPMATFGIELEHRELTRSMARPARDLERELVRVRAQDPADGSPQSADPSSSASSPSA